MKVGVVTVNGERRLTAETSAGPVDLAATAASEGVADPEGLLSTLATFLAHGGSSVGLAREVLGHENHVLASGQQAAPYVEGSKILCHVVNYGTHAVGVGGPSRPFFFYKPGTSVIATGEPIEPHLAMSQELDYETELALVIGRPGRSIPEDEAYDYVAGFTILNDISHREYQFNKLTPDHGERYGMNWTQGKGLDGSCPIGPWITTRDELAEPYPLHIRCWVNGELRQDANTAEMLFKAPELVAEISRGLTLRPGDIIATGSPSGTAMDGADYLRPGDVVRCEIERLGVLENPVGS